MICRLRIFSKLSPNTDQLSFTWWEEGVKSLQLEGTTTSHHRYITVGSGYNKPTRLVYKFSDARMAGISHAFLQMEIPLISWIKRMRIKGGDSNFRLMSSGQSLCFLSGLETYLITTFSFNTTLKVVFGSSEALKSRSGFKDLSPMPFNMQHVALVGERIPPSSGGYSLGFFSI